MSNNNKLITISIDLTKIPKDRIVEGKNGGKYMNFDVTIKDEPDQYGQDCSVAIRQSKEEREAKTPKQFCGNGKKLFGWDALKSAAPAKDDIDNELGW